MNSLNFERLGNDLKGDLFTDETTRILYSTDASAYKEMPLAVVRPRDKDDIRKVILFALENRITLIPRTAGTSLAGQVVGNGLIVDVSKYMTSIIEFNKNERWVRVEPGVVLDELNIFLKDHGLFFGPETSTSNRCMIGGMVGNNSCGAHSIIYGSTRDHTLEITSFLSDGSEAHFKPLTNIEFENKCNGEALENKLYKNIHDILSNPVNKEEIRKEFPNKSLKRRNNGYAIDLLLETAPFSNNSELFNFCKLIAGSEGTLAFITEIKLNLVPLPSKETAVICIHCHTVDEALRGNLIALKYHPVAVELMDNIVLECTKQNIEQNKNRFFLEGDPGALLIVELAENDEEMILSKKDKIELEMRSSGFGYHFPVIFGDDIKKVWALRKAGLGLLANIPGDDKAVAVTEDTAVDPEFLPDYIKDFHDMLARYGLTSVYHGHASTGELHLRPVLNLKDPAHVELFHTIAFESAKLVKKYKGSISGEHGDGRLRGEFIPFMIGEKNYQLIKELKNVWDPNHIFNKNKIVDTFPMNTHLRYIPGEKSKEINTIFDFSKDHGILRSAEKCNGSGDCRKSAVIGGTMCPSYMATRNESATTRARANILREFLTKSNKDNPFNHKEIYQVMDLCLSCKACKSECPSSVDVAKLKAEFLQHYYDSNGVPLRTKVIANISKINQLGSVLPSFTNFILSNKLSSHLIKKTIGFSTKRSLPLLYKITLKSWTDKYLNDLKPLGNKKSKIYFFIDEFSNYNDTLIGIKAIQLLSALGYEVIVPEHLQSGRTYLSKGLLRKAQKIAGTNVQFLNDIINEKTPLIGIEPSAILTFRDEYPELLSGEKQMKANQLAKNVMMIDEFIVSELTKGNISSDQFTTKSENIKLHGHCQQKSLASTSPTIKMLSIPVNYKVVEIKSGCCGMAGSFGYEKEHYELSMEIGELTLFPAIRNTPEETIMAATGTSCRQQIKDGTGIKAFHPVEILYDALL